MPSDGREMPSESILASRTRAKFRSWFSMA
jgi:hypothetical protein